MDLSDLQAKYGGFQRFQEQPQQPVQPKKVGGIKGLLAGLLPTIGGAIGAVGGTVAGPGGTVAGGAGGAALGEYLRQRLTGEDKDGIDKGNLLEQGAFGAIGALGKAKAVAGAAKATKTASAVDELDDVARVAKESRLTKAGKNMQAQGRGTTIAAKVSKATDETGYLQPSTAKKLNLDIDTLPGKTPAEKLASLETRQKTVGAGISDAVAKSNRPTSIDDLDNITSVAGKQSKKIQGWDADVASEANKTIGGAKDLDELYKIRKDLDSKLNSFYKAELNDTTATAKAETLKAYRDGIDKVLKDNIEGFEGLNKIYSKGFSTRDVLSRQASKKNNLKIPFFGVDTGIDASGKVSKAKESVGAVLRKAGGEVTPSTATGGFKPFAGQVARQTLSQATPRLFAAPFMGQPAQEDPSQAPVDFSTDIIDTPVATPQMQPQMPESDSPFTQANIQQAIIADLQTTGGKNVSTLTKLYETFKPEAGAAEKPLSAEAAKTVSNAKAGLESIADFENITAADPNALKKTIIPGRGLFGGALGSALGTGEIEAASQQIMDIIARLRTGAAISATEEARFKKFIPQAFDSEETKAQKMGYLKRQFQRVAERSGAASTDLEAAVL